MMKRISFALTAFFMSFTTMSQTATDIIQHVLLRQQQVEHISYTLQRKDTLGTHIRTMNGMVVMERDKADTLLGFRFWAKKENDNVDKMYNGRAGYAIDKTTSQYEMFFSATNVLNLFNGGGGHLVMRDLMKLDTSRALYSHLNSDDTAYYLLFTYSDLKEYDVFNRYKKVTISKQSLLPIAVREHQESYGRIQDLYFKITSCRENEEALRYDFFTPSFLQNYTQAIAVRKPSLVHDWIGKQVPAFILKGFKPGSVALNELKGNVVLLDFWEVWCGPCVQSMPKVQALYERYQQNGLVIYGVVNDTANFKATLQMIEKRNLSIPMLQGNEQVKQKFEINSVPLYLVIDRSGIIRFVEEGFSEKIEEAIKAAL